MRIVREPINLLNKIHIKDNLEPMIEAEKICNHVVFRLKPEVLEHEKKAYLRQTAAEMLNKAQSFLPDGYKLMVWDAWRDPKRQAQKYQRYFEQLKSEHPTWPLSAIRRACNRMLFPVDVKTPPPHSTGGTVDLTILDPKGETLDMMSPFTERYDEAITSSNKITPQAQKNRQLLFDVMTKTGFTNYSFEWWHYSYGDSAWALRLNKPYAIYDRTQPPGW